MDKEGQNANVPAFHSGDISNKATPDYFSNVKGGKKDKEIVSNKRSKKSRKALFITLGALAGALVVVLIITLVTTVFNHSRGSRTDETMPTTMQEIEERAYKVLHSGDENGYENTLYYLNDLILDMKDLNIDPEIIFAVYAVRARIAYEGGAKETGIEEALRLAREANTDLEKLYAYHELFYIYNREGNPEKRDFYGSLMDELNVDIEKDAVGGTPDEE